MGLLTPHTAGITPHNDAFAPVGVPNAPESEKQDPSTCEMVDAYVFELLNSADLPDVTVRRRIRNVFYQVLSRSRIGYTRRDAVTFVDARMETVVRIVRARPQESVEELMVHEEIQSLITGV